MLEISTRRLDLSRQAKKWVMKSWQSFAFKEESPYKPDTYFILPPEKFP
jgi:hypothetical protein